MASNMTYFWEVLSLIILAGGVAFALVPFMDDIFTPVEEDAITIHLYTHESGGWSFGGPPLGAQAQDEEKGDIILKKGEPVKIVLIGGDVPHSLVIPGLGIDSGPISPGKVKEIEFTPDKAGTFTFFCGVICSPEHHFLVYKLVVMEPEEYEELMGKE
jgi:heme/copper-type cytochrome/quinol oxidase subunit 2